MTTPDFRAQNIEMLTRQLAELEDLTARVRRALAAFQDDVSPTQDTASTVRRRPARLTDTIVEILDEAGEEGLTRQELVNELGDGATPASVSSLLAHLKSGESPRVYRRHGNRWSTTPES